VIYLGNIRDTHIKTTAIELVKKYPNQFKFDDFQHNKLMTDKYIEVGSKLMRNKIAGYITRYLASRHKNKGSRLISE
jgi:small subunit ribosomal protein S17e